MEWKNSFSVIEWFKNLTNKKNLSFIQFDNVVVISKSIFCRAEILEKLKKITADTTFACPDTDNEILKYARQGT